MLQKVGFFNQQYAEQLNMEETATEYLMRNFNLPYEDGRKCLGRFGLESHAHTIQISKLSGKHCSRGSQVTEMVHLFSAGGPGTSRRNLP